MVGETAHRIIREGAGDVKYIQVGVIGIRNPKNRYEILGNVPIYEKVSAQTQEAETYMHKDIAKVFATKIRQYIEADEQNLIGG